MEVSMLKTSCLFVVLAVGCMSLPPAQAQNPCETALLSPADVIELTPSSPFTAVSTGAEWESEILKFRVSRTGLLSLGVEGTGAEVSLQAHRGPGLEMVNGAPLEPSTVLLTPVRPSEVYCLRMTPELAGSS